MRTLHWGHCVGPSSSSAAHASKHRWWKTCRHWECRPAGMPLWHTLQNRRAFQTCGHEDPTMWARWQVIQRSWSGMGEMGADMQLASGARPCPCGCYDLIMATGLERGGVRGWWVAASPRCREDGHRPGLNSPFAVRLAGPGAGTVFCCPRGSGAGTVFCCPRESGAGTAFCCPRGSGAVMVFCCPCGSSAAGTVFWSAGWRLKSSHGGLSQCQRHIQGTWLEVVHFEPYTGTGRQGQSGEGFTTGRPMHLVNTARRLRDTQRIWPLFSARLELLLEGYLSQYNVSVLSLRCKSWWRSSKEMKE